MADENTLAATPGETEVVNLDQVAEIPAGTAATDQTRTTDQEEADGDIAGADDQSGDGRPRKLSGSRRERIRNDFLRRENAELRSQLEQTRRPAAGETEVEKEPQESDFNGDVFAYERAANAYNMRKIIREENARTDAGRRSTEQAELWRERAVAHQERVEEAKETIADFDQVLAAARVPVSDEVGQEILASDQSALLAYHLAKNPDKLQALNGMTGKELAREIGRLEGIVRAPASNRKTNAPTPIQPLRGGAAPAFDPSKSSMDDYIAKRNAGWSG